MPTDRKPLHRAHRSRLDGDQEMELWLGPNHRGSAFESEAQRQWAWTQHRDRLMVIWGKHGKRPWAWWRYEAGRPHPGDRQASTLYEMGVLSDEERAELIRWWSEQFERTYAAHFFFCRGPGRILEGAPARAAHLSWADCPRKLVTQWSKERQRRDRTIRKLKTTTSEPRDDEKAAGP
jgi:hypothetical protein